MNKEEIFAEIRAVKQQRAALATRVSDIRALMKDLGESPSAIKLATFTKTLKDIIK